MYIGFDAVPCRARGFDAAGCDFPQFVLLQTEGREVISAAKLIQKTSQCGPEPVFSDVAHHGGESGIAVVNARRILANGHDCHRVSPEGLLVRIQQFCGAAVVLDRVIILLGK
ncbi:hypothetical protein D9M72_630770 [compost metagenome]